jgi:hypothetical protein
MVDVDIFLGQAYILENWNQRIGRKAAMKNLFRFSGEVISIGFLILLLSSCSGGSSTSTTVTMPPFIGAELDSFPTGSVPLNVNNTIVNVQDGASGNAITNATAVMNGVNLSYNATYQNYEGRVVVAPGDRVTLTVKVGAKTYTASGTQFTSYPIISTPVSGATLSTSCENTISWSEEAPTTNDFYVFGVLDGSDPSGQVIWPSTGYLQTVPIGTNSYNIPANSLTVGNRLVIVGIATVIPIPDAAADSGLLIGGFNSAPITVIDGSGSHWTKRQAGWSTADFRGVTWSGTQFVTVGGFSGTIFTSSDGATWTEQTSGNPNPLNSVAWGGNQFVAVGGSGTVLTSPDGVTWTSRNSGTTASLSDVIWSGQQFVAVGTSYDSSTGYTGTILTSSDGVNWTITLPGTNVYIYQVTWSGSQFVAVGGLGGSGSPNTNVILTSTDGVTWSSRTAGTSNQLLGVSWSGTQFVIVGMGGTVLTSPDGITWTVRTSGTTTTLFNVAWSGLNFVTVGLNHTILTSPDGITWTALTSYIIYTDTLYDITWSGTRFVAVGSGGAIFSSP